MIYCIVVYNGILFILQVEGQEREREREREREGKEFISDVK